MQHQIFVEVSKMDFQNTTMQNKKYYKEMRKLNSEK